MEKMEKDDYKITFKKGQAWKYHARGNEPESRVIVLKVEQYENAGEVIHISVVGLSMKNKHDSSWLGKDISHMPFSKEALMKSVITFDKMVEVPDFSEGYVIWKDAFDKGKAGVYSVSVSEVVDFMEQTINDGYESHEE
ncbi:hypothetical protein [Marinicella sp. W31]|uniref:hypothetical protein n=1 Tax=Marinicella sp. W31 TaxID=3023713 RepID=UPI0037581D1D